MNERDLFRAYGLVLERNETAEEICRRVLADLASRPGPDLTSSRPLGVDLSAGTAAREPLDRGRTRAPDPVVRRVG